MHIINAEEQHIPAIRRIYAHHVLHGTGSFETEPPDTQEMLARVKNVQSRGFPWYIALQGETVIGYCYLSATANAMPTGLRLKIRCTSIRLISGRGRKSLTRSCLNMGPVSGIPPDDSGCGGQCERRVCSAASSRRIY